MSQLLYVRMHRTRKKTTKNIGIGASVAGTRDSNISANCYIVDLEYMWSEEHNRYEHEAQCICLLGGGWSEVCDM